MQTNPMEWADVSALLPQYGNARWVGERVKELRTARGWSQPELSQRLAESGWHIPQSTIWKIENPERTSRTGKPIGRKSLTIDEALALARVFDTTLDDLLLPPDTREEVEHWRLLTEAAERMNAIRSEWAKYSIAVGKLQARIASSPKFASRVKDYLDQLSEKHQSEARKDWITKHPSPELTDAQLKKLPKGKREATRKMNRRIRAEHERDLEAHLRGLQPLPAMVAAQDALGGEEAELNPFHWFEGRRLNSSTRSLRSSGRT